MKRLTSVFLTVLILISACLPAGYAAETEYQIFSLGKYEQNGRLSDGPETMEWIILDTQGTKLLFLSRYAIDIRPFNESGEACTWETSSIRAWLNGEFLETVIPSELSGAICLTELENERYSKGADCGKPTEDKVFLLSEYEADHYFATNSQRRAFPTDMCAAEIEEHGCWWMLRTMGSSSKNVMGVHGAGGLNYNGRSVDEPRAVRPAMWVDIGILDAISLRGLGDLYFYGADGYEQSYSMALEHYEKAAVAGDVEAIVSVGTMYRNGLGVEQDYAAALELYFKAAESGSATAFFNIGSMYACGFGVERDAQMAMFWFEKGAALGEEQCLMFVQYPELLDMVMDAVEAETGETGNNAEEDQDWIQSEEPGDDAALTASEPEGDGTGTSKNDDASVEKIVLADQEGVIIEITDFVQNGTKALLSYSIKNTRDEEITVNLSRILINGHKIEDEHRQKLYIDIPAGVTGSGYAVYDLEFLAVFGEKQLESIGVELDVHAGDHFYPLLFKVMQHEISVKNSKPIEHKIRQFDVELCNEGKIKIDLVGYSIEDGTLMLYYTIVNASDWEFSEFLAVNIDGEAANRLGLKCPVFSSVAGSADIELLNWEEVDSVAELQLGNTEWDSEPLFDISDFAICFDENGEFERTEGDFSINKSSWTWEWHFS